MSDPEGTSLDTINLPEKPTAERQAEEASAASAASASAASAASAEEAAAKLAKKREKEIAEEVNKLDKATKEGERKGETEEPAAQKTCVVTKKYKDLDDNERYVHGEKIFTKGGDDEEKPNDYDDVYVKFEDQQGGKRKKRKTAKKSRKTKKKARKTGKKARKTGKK